MLLEKDTLEAQGKRLTAVRTVMHADASDRRHRGLLPRSRSTAQDFHFGQLLFLPRCGNWQIVAVERHPVYAAAISAAMFFGVSVMHTVSITESYAVPRENLGLVLFGRDPTEHLKQLFIERRYTSSTTAESVVKAKLFYSELDFDT